MASRNAFFLSMCNAADGNLLDITDPTLKGRLEKPSHAVNSHNADYYPDAAKRQHHEGRTVVAVIIEINGETKHAAVIVSSGYDDLDKAAIYAFTSVKYDVPYMLDGNPVRVLQYSPVTWKLTPPPPPQ
jgi:TonB family protein